MYCVKLNNNEIHCPDVNSESHCLARRSLGREKQLAIFFLDIRNYTKLMDTYAHYDVLFIARILLESFCKTIISLGGKIIEVSGDNIYAVFGINSDLRSAVRSSLKAARAVLAQLKEFNQEHIFPYCNSILEIGIGLHQ
ncbi:adenylate/guanylate cyclase domain-containing protein [Mucilaginibacter endophyticus]|nr:adenylate/guanylate cyclase domain-containing protein [Mucilaginibacter endophyticus]